MKYSQTARPSSQLAKWRFVPINFFAFLGGIQCLFMAYVIGRWILSDSFVATDPGPDPLPEWVKWTVFGAQVLGPLLGAWMYWHFLIQPWRQTGAISAEGLLCIAWSSVYFLDPSMSYTVNHLTYNAYLVNFGAWTTGIWPGWTAPNTHKLAEPILVGIPAYPLASLVPAIFVCRGLQLARARWPSMSMWAGLGVALFMLMLADLIIEGTLVRTQIENYAGAIRKWSLWGGEWYQFPLYESVFWGLNAFGTLLLLFFRDDRGNTWVEKGVDHLRLGRRGKTLLRLLALIGFVHLWMIFSWTIPMNWFGTHADPFPDSLPSYLRNGMCGEGTAYPCPGPGVPIPRVN